MVSRVLRIALLLLLVPAFSADAQIPSRLRQKVKERVEKASERAMDKGLQLAEDAVKCAITDQACIDKAKAEGKEVGLTDEQGNLVEVIPAGEPTAAAPAAVKPGEGAWANYDFVPGEKVLFFDDFSLDRVGNFPKRLEFYDGNMEVVEWEGRRWLRVNAESAFGVPLPEAIPDRFTMEFEVTIPWGMLSVYVAETAESGVPGHLEDRAMIVVSQFYQAGVVAPGGQRRSTVYPEKVLPPSIFTQSHEPTAPVHVRVHVDGAYVKVYLEEHRVANVPNADLLRANKLIFHWHNPGQNTAPLITNVSVNAGADPMYDALMADGRFVTQGILFDTGSDRLRPESTPTLEEIASMLQSHPELRVRVEGHTDAVGDDAANLQLSDRRAAAVKDYLVGTKGIDTARLETQGLGETVPVGSNDTPEGRQQNRRVELVRLQ